MTSKQFYTLFADALEQADRDAFVSDWLLSSVWFEDPYDASAEIPSDLTQQIGDIWDVALITIAEIRRHVGLTQAQLAERFCIPLRTLQGWETGRPCPNHTRLMMAELLGIYKR